MPGHPGSDGAGPPRHLRRIVWAPRHDLSRWPFTLPAVRQLVDDGGLDVPAGVTVLVGENGSGKSTLVEAFAAVYPRAGARTSRPAEVDVTGPGPSDEDSPLRWHLRGHPPDGGAGRVLPPRRAHALLSHRHRRRPGRAAGVGRRAPSGALPRRVVPRRAAAPLQRPRVYFLDEPAYDELELVQSWREFLAAPGRWLRHLVDVPE